jgi:hypothetical protein
VNLVPFVEKSVFVCVANIIVCAGKVYPYDNDLKYFNRLLSIQHLPGSHTQDAIADAVTSACKQWRIIGKLTAVTTDFASNLAGLEEALVEKMHESAQACELKIYQVGCAAHLINLIVQKLSKTKSELENDEWFVDFDADNWEQLSTFQSQNVRELHQPFTNQIQLWICFDQTN